MQYRDFGSLGFKVSGLGFGAMRLPENERGEVDRDAAVTLIRAAVDAGINYIDTAPLYNRGQSEGVVAEALASGYREKVWLSTKNNNFTDPGEWRRLLEKQLTTLRVPYVDVYHLWGINWETWSQKIIPRGILTAARRAHSEGLFRHLFFSFHGPPDDVNKLIDTGEFAGCTVQYNLIDRRLEKSIAYARAKGLGVVVMGPVGGGRLAGPSAILDNLAAPAAHTAELALRFVLANPDVSCALSGMSTPAMLAENVAVASRTEPLSETELAAIRAKLDEYEKLAQLYCTGCDYCLPCPEKIPIGRIFHLYTLLRVYKLEEPARRLYAEIGRTGFYATHANASACTGCGECATKCPQRLDIPKELAAAHAALTTEG